MNMLICSKCGGELIAQNDNTFKCKFCGTIFHEDTVEKQKNALAAILDEEKMSRVAALKKDLWKKVNEEYADSEAITRICHDIKQLAPEDFYANFYEAVNSDSEDRFIAQLNGIDVIEHYDDIEEVLDYALKSISPKNMLSICNLIERAFKQNDLSKYNEYRTRYDRQCALLNDCVYDPAYPRDAFICYSSKDMPKVESLVKYLEDQGLLCFVAVRNMQHGRGAVSNYWKALHTAIENCKCIVFLSSVNSRSLHCDALEELRYVQSVEQKQNRKIKKIEYLLDNYTGVPVERNFKKIFDGLEYCYDEETVFDRITWEEPETEPEVIPEEISAQKEVKYCVKCGKENSDNVKYCSDCGNDEFVSTQAELIEYLRKKQQELEESRKKAQEEAERQKEAAAAAAAVAAVAADRQSTADLAPAEEKAEEDRPFYYDEYFSGKMSFEDIELPNNERNDAASAQSDAYYAGDDKYELIKGQSVILPPATKKVKVTVKNQYKLEGVEADLYVFLLDRNDRVLSEADLVFFGNQNSLNRSVVMDESGESAEIFFNKVNQDIAKIRFIISFNMDDGKIRNFTMLNSSVATFLLEDQAYSFEMRDVGRFESVSAFEFYRVHNKWKLSIQAAGLRENIGNLCADYGIDVE